VDPDFIRDLVARGVLYFKADGDGAARFSAEGCAPFDYATKSGKRTITSYWRVPDRLLDEPDELAEWARVALSAARAAKKVGSKRTN
jgi:DNA transformation protein